MITMISIKRISKSVHQLDVLHRKLPLLNFERCDHWSNFKI